MNETEKAYIAGIVDGEGCVGIHKKARPNNKKTGFEIVSHVSVTNCKKELLDWLLLTTGIGKIYFKTYKNKPSHHSDCWTWNLYTKQAHDFLIEIFPYLRIKKRQAELIVKLYKSKRVGIPLTDDKRNFQIECLNEVKNLNKRGK